MHRESFIAKLTEIQRTVEQLLTQLQASDHDKFAAHLYRSRREANRALPHLGVSSRREHGIQGGHSPMAGTSADWRLRFAILRIVGGPRRLDLSSSPYLRSAYSCPKRADTEDRARA